MPTKIDSPAQWRQILSSHTVVIADFYADWCGPCKMIAPTFESLAIKYAKPNKIAFVKVDVDAQGEVAQQYAVRAMPTFLVLRNGSVIDTVQGASPPALTAAVDKAVKPAGVGGGGATFSGSGNRLGGAGVGRPVGGGGRPGVLWTLFSVGCLRRVYFAVDANVLQLDPYKSAEKSPFNRNGRPSSAQPGSGTKLGGRPAAGGVRTIADLGSE